MNEDLKKLYDTLLEEDLISVSFDEFKESYKEDSYKQKVFDAVVEDDLYSKDFNTFSSQYSIDEEVEEVEEKPETKYKSDIDVTSFFNEDPVSQKDKDFSYFDQDFNKLDDEIGGVFGNLEETVAKDLDTKFKKWGFVFEEAIPGKDAIKITSTKDPNLSKTFDLDDPNKSMYAIRSFLDKNKRDNAVYAESVTDISIDDDYVQDLLKATAENDEDKKNNLLTGISRKIYASEGVNYDEIKNLESKGNKNQEEIDFINKNLLKTTQEFDPELGKMINVGKQSVENYTGSKEDIKKYPNIFNEDGSLKIDPLKYQIDKEQENTKIADITASDLVYEIKSKEKALFDKFKNKEAANIIEENKIISSKTQKLSNDFQDITGFTIGDFDKANLNIERQVNSYEKRINDITGTSINNLNDFVPESQEQADQVQQVLDEYNTYYSQTIAPINNIYKDFSSLGEQQRQISNVGNTINSMLAFDDLFKYRGQYEDSKFKSILNNAKLGWSQGEVNEEFLKAAYGIVDPNDAEEMGNIAKTIAEETAYQKGLLTSDTWERYQNASTVAEQLKILGTDPGEVLLSLFGNSMTMFAGTGKSIFIPVVGGSTAVVAASGATAGGVGAIPGALTGLGYGLTTWQTITGFNMELGSAYSEELTKAGYDLSDAEQVVAGLKNQEVVDKATERGVKRGIPIAVANFVGARVAGSMVNPLATTGRQVVQQFGKGMLIEPIFEGGGELGAQVLSDGNVVGTEILNEMIGGMPGTQSNIAVQFAKNNFITTQSKLANKLENVNYVADNNYGYNDVRAFTNRLLNKKKITQEQANKIIENARIVDETNSLMRKSPKFIGGKRKTNARKRIADLIQTRNSIDAANDKTADILGVIESEIQEIATTGKVLKSSDVITANDFINNISRQAQVAANLISKKLKSSNIEILNINEESSKDLINNNPEVYNAIKQDIQDGVPGFITPSINGKQYIVVNQKAVSDSYANALLEGDLTGTNVISHEVLHAVLDASFDEAEVKELGENLESYILDDTKNVISKGARSRIKNKLTRYEKQYGGKTNEYYQEVFTTLSDEMADENIDFNRQDRNFWQSIADTVNDFMYKNKDTFDEVTRKGLKIKSPEQAFNFVKDYNKVYKKGNRIFKGQIKPKAPVIEDKVRRSIITKGEDLNDFINSKMTKDQFQRERTVDVNGRMMTPFDAAYTAVNGPVFDRLIGARVKDTKGVSREDFIQSVKDNLSNLLVTFDPQQNDNLFAWVNSQVANKIGTVAKKQGPKTVSTDKTIDESGRTLADTLRSEELDVEARSLQESKEVFTLTDKIDLSVENKSIIENEVAKVNFTKLPDPSEQITKNKTVTPFVSELKQSIGKTTSGSLSQASRAVVVQMGKRGQYVPYLRKNLPFIIKKLPIGYLAKNMPGVVMKSVNGEYTSNWQGKNIDKYTQAETGMSSQPQKMKLKSSITKEDINNIINKFAKTNGSPVQSKQEGLAYQIASELGLEMFSNSLLEDNEISKNFKKSQQLLERPDPNSIVGKMTSDIERGIKGVRYTILQTSPTAFIAANAVLPSIINKISSPSLNAKEATTLIKQDLKLYIKEALQDEINLDNPSITSIVNKITDIVTKARNRAVNAYNKQFKVGPRVDIEAEILKGLEFDFESPGVISFFNLDQSMSDIFKSAENVNNLRRSFLEQAKQEIEAGRDPLDVIKDFIKWDGDHLKSSSKIGDGQFTISNNKNDLGQNVVNRNEDAISGETNRAQVFENVQDFVDNLLNLISDKYEATSTTKGIIVKETATGVQINLDTTTPAQKSKNVINEIKQNGEQATYKNRLNFANEARARIKSRMEYLKKKNDPILSAMTMASFKSNMKAILRAAANAEYIFVGDLNTDEKIVYEHLTPAEVIVMLLLDTYFGKSKISVDEIFKNYHVALIPESMDNILKEFGFQQTMPKGFLQDLSKFLQRYYNDLTYGSVQYAVKSLKDGKVDELSQEFATAYELNNNEQTTKVNRKSLMPSGIVPGNESNTYMVNASINMTEALDNSIKNNAPIKKIRVFDFDDTLATSKNIVTAIRDNEKIKLNAEEFAERGKKLVEEGYVMDFSDFNRVTNGNRGPLFTVAQKIKEARGNEDLFVLTARAPESRDAIYEFLKSQGLEFKKENIIGLGNSTGEAKAQWLVSKAAEGYNDFYFADDAFANVKAVKDALAPLDIKSKIQQAKVRYSILSNEFNDIIEKNTGIESFKEYSAAKAKTIGASKGNFKFWIPYSAEDFMGLIYPILGKGTVGDKQMAWFKENTIRPYTKAMESLSKDRINLMSDFKALKKQLNIPKIIGKKNNSGFTNEQSVRVYIWNKQGFDVPGLSKNDLNDIIKSVENNKNLKLFADQLQNILKEDMYSKPSQNWLAGTITTDLIDTLNKGKRAKYLQQWQANIDSIFSEANLNKLEAIYGSKYREALENVLSRMKAGSNRLETGSRLSNRILDYINGSVGAIMFLNIRSAALQTISSINFINWSFNNPLKAGQAFANQSQYWKDFSKIMNSDYLVDRRNGQKIDINEAEIRNAAATSKNKAKAAINYLLQKGFLPTQIADSFAIALGGATYYRNRIKNLVSQGMSLVDAEKQAMLEFREVAEESQQSSDPSRISQQQASSLGRVILAFANTPMQYGRLTKRAYQDLVNGRGDAKSNISKIIYYTFVQNIIFNALQQGLFALGFGDDEEDDNKKEEKYMDIANGMLDTQLRGLGIGGAAVSVIKNFLTDLYERSERDRPEYVDSVWKLMQFSPPISSKISKLRQAA